MESVILSSDVPSDLVRTYVHAAISDNTRRAYRSDPRHFIEWGGAIPASDVMVADYLARYAGTLSVATLARRVASISKAHAARGLYSPARSELVAINCTDIEPVKQGVVVHVHRSKTDQEGAGRKVGIPHGRTRRCPVTALNDWLGRAGIEEGPVLRPVDRHGRVHDARLSAEAVSLVVKGRAAAVGLDPDDHSGHSLRAGLATSAAAAGVSSWKIRLQTGHASEAMLAR